MHDLEKVPYRNPKLGASLHLREHFSIFSQTLPKSADKVLQRNRMCRCVTWTERDLQMFVWCICAGSMKLYWSGPNPSKNTKSFQQIALSVELLPQFLLLWCQATAQAVTLLPSSLHFKHIQGTTKMATAQKQCVFRCVGKQNTVRSYSDTRVTRELSSQHFLTSIGSSTSLFLWLETNWSMFFIFVSND